MGADELRLLKSLLRKYHCVYGRHAMVGLQNKVMDSEMRKKLSAIRW
mgnify:CR=1 FL=1